MRAKHKVRKILAAAAVLLLTAALIAVPAILRDVKSAKEDNAVILSTMVERGEIRQTISASGTLKEQEGETVELPEGVELKGYLVKNGQIVRKGEALAEVDRVTVMGTVIALKEQIDRIDEQLQAAASDVYTSNVLSTAMGRVKAIYAAPGDDVRDVVREHGALAVLSLDGLMAVKVESAELQVGTAVSVKTPDGKEYPGRTESAYDGVAVVTLTDDGPLLGETADVFLGGRKLGSGELYVHSAWNVTAIGGVVNSVGTKPEWIVYKGTSLFQLKDVKDSTGYNALVTQRRKYEDTMFRLFQMYRTGTITAPCDGCVTGIDTAKLGLLSDTGEYQVILLGFNKPEQEIKTGVIDRVGIIVYSDPMGTLLRGYSSSDGSVDYQKEPELDETQLTETFFVDNSDPSMIADPPRFYQWNGTVFEKMEDPPVFEEQGKLVLAYDDENSDGNPDKLLWGVYWPVVLPPPGNDFSFGGSIVQEEPEEPLELQENELMKIVPQETVTAELTVDEMDILVIRVGQEAEVLFDALPGKSFPATVSEISAVGSNNGLRTKYKVTVSMPREENMLGGMNVTAVLSFGSKENILTVPSEALVERGRKTLVYTGYDEKKDELTDPVEVVTGLSDGARTEILSGLEEGSQIWYSYYVTAAMTASAQMQSGIVI